MVHYHDKAGITATYGALSLKSTLQHQRFLTETRDAEPEILWVGDTVIQVGVLLYFLHLLGILADLTPVRTCSTPVSGRPVSAACTASTLG